MTTDAKGTFRIGFALSGAISAGAYTAGVLDYFFQALNEWEKVKKTRQDVPQHTVTVQVIAGASAGAITGALGAVALARGIRPQQLSDAEKTAMYPTGRESQDLRCVLPALYETWVNRPRMVNPGGIDFLSIEDLDTKSARVVSALNAKLLDDIKEKALLPPATGEPPETPPPYPYVADNLHVYMTVSNLRGIPYEVSFGNSTFGMQTHGDRGHYTIVGLGSGASTSNPWIAADSKESLTIDDLPAGKPIPANWDGYGTCALASSAFPIGLAPQLITAPFAGYDQRSYPMPCGGGALKPKFPEPRNPKGFIFLNVDGGMINNNPFDYAQYALMGDAQATATAGDSADRAVIMVSPFPEPPAFLPEGQPAAELVAVVRALFPALIDQARFKTAELVPAMDESDHSRFLIAPDREIDGVPQKYNIACGLLGGFGGFLDEKFRAHDFQLGRRNCQRFLERHFSLPPENRIVADLKSDAGFEVSQGAGKYRVIPRLGSAWPEVALPQWPRMSQADFDTLMRRIRRRLGKVAPRFVQAQTASHFFRALGRIGLFLGRGKVLNYARFAILSDMVRRDQIEGWELPPKTAGSGDDVRVVLAELANPQFTFRTADGIAAKTHLNTGFVAGVLKQFLDEKNKPFRVWQGEYKGKPAFTLVSRVSWFWSQPIIRQIGYWLEPPTVD